MTGVPPSGSGHSGQAPEPASGLGHSASVPNAFELLALRCEAADGPSRELDQLIAVAKHGGKIWQPQHYSASFDAALSLLELKNDWRRLTPKSVSVYAASPYNAAAQVRYDGYGATPALQLCAAFLKMLAAREAKASAIDARRAATAGRGAKHESAVPKADAQTPSGDAQ